MSEKAKRILVTDDERAIANAFKLKLERAGFYAVVAHNGQEAIDILKKEQFDIMLLDLVMPVMDGFGVLKELKARKNKMPIIVTTNLSQEEDEKQAMELGASGYLVKSDVPISEIVEYVKKTLS